MEKLLDCLDYQWQKESNGLKVRQKGLWLHIVKWYLLLDEIPDYILSLIFNTCIISKLFSQFVSGDTWKALFAISFGEFPPAILISLCGLFDQGRSKHIACPIVEVCLFLSHPRRHNLNWEAFTGQQNSSPARMLRYQTKCFSTGIIKGKCFTFFVFIVSEAL